MGDSSWGSARPLIAGRATSAAVAVLLPAVLARGLDQADFGTYKQLFIVANLALYTLQLGLTQSLFYFVPRATDDGERRAWLAQTQAMLLVLGLVAGASVLAGAPHIAARFSNPALAELAWPLSLLAGSLVAASPLEIGLTARGRPGLSALALVSTDLLRVAAMLVPFALGYGLQGVAWGAAGASVVKCLLSMVTTLGGGAGTFDTGKLGRQLAYALPFGLAVLVALPQQQLHQFVVASNATPAIFALYSVGCLQIPIVGLLYSPVSETMQVRLGLTASSDDGSQAAGIFATAVSQLASVFLPLCAFLAATATPGLLILYGSDYVEAASVFRIAVASVAISSLPVDGLLKARDRTRTLFVANVAKLAVTWPVVVWGWRQFGMTGAIGAHVLIEATARTCLLFVVARELGVGVLSLVGRGLLQGTARAGIVGAVAWSGVALGSSAWMDAGLATVFAAAVLAVEWGVRRRAAGEGRRGVARRAA